MMTKRLLLAVSLALLAGGIGSAQAETITVTVDKMAFSPADISAKVGDTIEWVNKDSFAHTATVKGGWEVMLPVKKSGSMVVDKAGTIAYICRFHPNMKGTITVTAK
jgi:plastocyanin